MDKPFGARRTRAEELRLIEQAERIIERRKYGGKKRAKAYTKEARSRDMLAALARKKPKQPDYDLSIVWRRRPRRHRWALRPPPR